jgi:hypothetical protein
MAETVLGSEVAGNSPEIFVSSNCVSKSAYWISATEKVVRISSQTQRNENVSKIQPVVDNNNKGVPSFIQSNEAKEESSDWFCRKFYDHRGFFLDLPNEFEETAPSGGFECVMECWACAHNKKVMLVFVFVFVLKQLN